MKPRDEVRFHFTDPDNAGRGRTGRAAAAPVRGPVPNRTDISECPAVVVEKSRAGDSDADAIVGANHTGTIVSAVDRATKFTLLARAGGGTADEVGRGLMARLGDPNVPALAITSDNGKEFAGHASVAAELGADFYFAQRPAICGSTA